MITQARLKELFNYDQEIGLFTWRVNRGNVRAGDIAGYLDPKGYMQIGVDGQIYYAHRLVFLYMTGSFPPVMADHINQIKNDNRWINLRPATNGQNKCNSPSRKGSSSKYLGVSWNKASGKWHTTININGNKKSLGYFTCEHDAATVYNFAAHQHHGEFANYNLSRK